MPNWNPWQKSSKGKWMANSESALLPVRRHVGAILRLSIPIIVGQLGIMILGFADTLMVGRYGTPELSAAGFVNNFFNLAIFSLLGLSYSATPIVGAFYGKGDARSVGCALRESLKLNLLGGLIIFLVMAFFYFHIELLRQPEELLSIIRPYYLAILFSVIPLALFNSLKQCSDAVNQPQLGMWVMTSGNILNILLNVLLIYGIGPFPEWGLFGAGIATLISRFLMALFMLLYIFISPHFRPFLCKSRGQCTWRGIIRQALIGLPISVQLLLETASFEGCAIFMGWIGAIPLAAHQVMITISSFCFLVFYGIGAAISILISQYRGRGKWSEVVRLARIGWGMCLFCGIWLTGIIYGLHEPIARLFTEDSDVVATISTLLLPFIFYQFGDCTQIVYSNALRGIEQVGRMMFSAFVAFVLVSIPMSYILAFPLHLGAAGVWWGLPFGLTIAGILYSLDFHRATAAT